ncbi:MAG TPA: phage baseplate assembly protein V [Acetobacteraceae bacterium]|nr:phage baseplate assembly protein V [Acetobacteraceae bacterium]
MSVDAFWNSLKRNVAAMIAQSATPRRGIVQSINPAGPFAKVTLVPEGALTGWLPIAMPCAANGWGVIAVPPVGAQVIVLPIDGDSDSSVVIAAHWSQPMPPPSGYPVGELWLFHQTGAFVKVNNAGGVQAQDQKGAILTADGTGKVIAVDQAGATMELPNDGTARLIDKAGHSFVLNNNGSATLGANLIVQGTITTQAPSGGSGNLAINGNIAATGDVQANAPNGVTLGTHVHGGVQEGGGNTEGPANPIS